MKRKTVGLTSLVAMFLMVGALLVAAPMVASERPAEAATASSAETGPPMNGAAEGFGVQCKVPFPPFSGASPKAPASRNLCQSVPCSTDWQCCETCPLFAFAICRNGLCAYGF